ncbi:hypothetical protein [Maritalea sp.]|uniref:hypothetical protein n=1 Tax=Maritalea sp. TaxID=2003361 RepID=UPI003EFAC155
MTLPKLLPEYITPAELGEHYGLSERTMREKLRDLGTYAMIGRQMVIYPEQVEQFKEATKCPTKSTYAGKFGTTGARLPAGDYAVLREQTSKNVRKGSRRMRKPKHGEVISMDQGRT